MSTRIAIVGSGQLARMMALDGIPMGMCFSFLVEAKESTDCVDGLGRIVVRRGEAEKIYEDLGKPDVITVEKEHVDIDLLRQLQAHCAVHPNPDALEIFKNRKREKLSLQSLGIPLAAFQSVSSAADLQQAVQTLDKPIFLKSEEEGYDGYNQYRITADNETEVIDSIDFPSAWVAEGFVAFEREVSFLAARNVRGDIVFYPAVENLHSNGTLLRSIAPAPSVSEPLLAAGRKYLEDILVKTDYVGLICMECFVVGERLLVNEIAPRVHNSGHWTSKGALTSQFENHLRAITDLPLGSTQPQGISGMLNLLGVTLSAAQASEERCFLTLYGKTPQPRRKLGHITINSDSYEDVAARLAAMEKLAYGGVSV
ncbi:5-(carboxyamino)imidazole ribonucleotide synthase [Exilibacterium tricleocarpae]|uniref:N5-carboxyaminoimidazole ribonucleotide synthase n=1 Tax=Exilibacterium tricleocarpae TaxID=2591008 RepID=A0A545T025_9GAMM|nr:5-(carboxyamino)imidazole ribonucleotide synthase [Exilibacterium tricleocarpae]TQV70529.1 5-(carboxyamino)imidazole ribonucleotide synthase [Exilibacterium tricleocarpae]